MTYEIVRRADIHDHRNAEEAARKFALRHGIALAGNHSWLTAVFMEVEYRAEMQQDRHLLGLWTRVFCKALGVRQSVRIGIHSDMITRTVQA
ncbi:MAG: hypothetical protein ACR2IJ_04840 [Fluviibacter sp.]